MPAKGKDDTRFAAPFGGLSLAFGLLILLVGAIGWVVTARFVAEALPGVAEVVSSRDYRGRYGNDRCCVTTSAVVGADGSRFTGVWRDPVRYVPGGSVNVLYRRGPSYRPARIVPNDEWAVWGGARGGLKMGGTMVAMGAASLLIGSLLRRRVPDPV